ncbi:MAG: endopeptidase La [Anaeroplasmataceae bacterium]
MEELENIGLPAIAVRGLIPIPNNEFRIEVGREISLKALEACERKYNNEIILLIQKNPLVADVTPDDLQPIGVLAKLTLKLKLPNNNYKVKFNIISRVMIDEFLSKKPYFIVKTSDYPTILVDGAEESALIRSVITEVTKNSQTVLNSAEDVLRTIQSGVTTEQICDTISYHLRSTNSNKYRYLEEQSLAKRMEYILEDIAREKQIGDIENKINQDVKKSIDESQKEYYLREKMKAIQNELGDKARQDEEVEELREKILAAKMPKKIEEKALAELQRYSNTAVQMAESGIIKSYLDFIIALPWHEATVDENDITKVQASLDKNHYGLDKVKDRILEYLSVKIMTNRNPQTILCLVGPPGVGKTSLAKSIAEALGRKFIKQSLGGISDESEIRGHRRTYIGALPGRILKAMKDCGKVNPVFLLDEIDKMTSNSRGDPSAAMLEVLDPEQNAHFSDNYLEEEYDLSQVMFITTANDLSGIPGPLRDRMEIIELSSYTEFEKFNIAKSHLLDRQLEAHGLKPEMLTINDDVYYAIIQHYTREAGVRELNRMIGTICRKAVKKILVEKCENVLVTTDNLEEYLGKIRFFNNVNREVDQVGIVTGLAYTTFGGDTLDIEVTYYKGKGGLVLTGKLGDVMKESAMAALSYVKAHADDFNIDPQLFSDNDIHIHVPEGAVPKDGPSAGVTMTTAIVSALTGRKVDAHLGMTGEITLRGSVLPIGGLKEKAIAAHRSGLTTILIPDENQRDIDEIPEEVQNALTIIPVKNVMEVIDRALV